MLSPILRQILVIGACQLAALSAGGAVAYPMVLLQQLRGNDTAIVLDLDTSSWIGSIHGIAGVLSITIPTFMQWKGRRAAFMVSCFAIATGWVVVYISNSITTILIGESFLGFGTNSLFTVSILSMSEMTSPIYRNVYVQSYALIQALGMATTGIMSKFLNWKTIGAVMAVPIFIASILALFWPGSPYWLAYKSRFDECQKSFRTLRRMDSIAKKELEELLALQTRNLHILREKNSKKSLLFYWNMITGRDFYLPFIHIFLLLNLMYWSGVGVVLIYSLETIQKTTNSDVASFYGIIVMNVILFLGMCLSSILVKKYDNKTILLISTVCITVTLFIIFVVTLLQTKNLFPKTSFLCLYLLLVYMAVGSLGVIPIVFSLISEIMPVKHRGVDGAAYIIFNCFLYASTLKSYPYLFLFIDTWGTFLLFTLNALICGLLIWKYVPETKNRTLLEIENYYTFGTFVIANKIQENEPMIVTA